jgi:hypothetical protein
VRGWLRIRVLAMVWMARLRARSPPWLSRWRMVCPLEASIGGGRGECGEGGIGAAAPGVGERDESLGGADGADSGPGGQLGDQVVDDRGQLGAVGLERAGCLAQCQGEPADLSMAEGLLSARAYGLAAPEQPG